MITKSRIAKSSTPADKSSLPDVTHTLKKGMILAETFKIKRLYGQTPAGNIYLAENVKRNDQKVAILAIANGVKITFSKKSLPNTPNISQPRLLVSGNGIARYIITKLPIGKPIRSYKRVSLPPNLATSAILQLLSNVSAIHQTGAYHGNICPETVSIHRGIGNQPEAHLLYHGAVSHISFPRMTHFLAPEQILGEGKIDGREDFWAIGVVLYHLLYEKLPFDGNSNDEISGKIILKEPQFPAVKDIPPELIAVMKKALEKDPEDRYQNITNMTVDLLSVHELYEETIVERVADAPHKPIQTPSPPLSPSPIGPASRRRKRTSTKLGIPIPPIVKPQTVFPQSNVITQKIQTNCLLPQNVQSEALPRQDQVEAIENQRIEKHRDQKGILAPSVVASPTSIVVVGIILLIPLLFVLAITTPGHEGGSMTSATAGSFADEDNPGMLMTIVSDRPDIAPQEAPTHGSQDTTVIDSNPEKETFDGPHSTPPSSDVDGREVWVSSGKELEKAAPYKKIRPNKKPQMKKRKMRRRTRRKKRKKTIHQWATNPFGD